MIMNVVLRVVSWLLFLQYDCMDVVVTLRVNVHATEHCRSLDVEESKVTVELCLSDEAYAGQICMQVVDVADYGACCDHGAHLA